MTQNWDPKAYARDGAYVHQLAGGVVEWLAPRRGERILDLGCGDGQLTARIAAGGIEIRGVDSSAAMVAAARERGWMPRKRAPRAFRIRMLRLTPCFPMRCFIGFAGRMP